MKKAIVLLLALAVLGGAVFAQDEAIAISGYVSAGAKIVNNDDGTSFQNFNYDWGVPGTSAYVDASYNGAMSGFDITLYGDTVDGFVLDTAYGWISPMDGLKLIAGNYYGGAFDGVDDYSKDFFASEGIFATYSISGFTAGAGFNPETTASEEIGFVFGAAYMLEDMFKARFSGTMLTDQLNGMTGSISVLAVPALTLKAGYVISGMVGAEDSFIDATVGYKVMDPLAVQVVAYDYLNKEYYSIAPRVTYTVSDALSVYGQVAVLTEGKNDVTNYATIKPRARVTYTPDDASTFLFQAEYDTDAKVTTVYLNYIFSF